MCHDHICLWLIMPKCKHNVLDFSDYVGRPNKFWPKKRKNNIYIYIYIYIIDIFIYLNTSMRQTVSSHHRHTEFSTEPLKHQSLQCKIFGRPINLQLELFAMGPVQFSWPRGVAENWFTKLDFGEHFVSFSWEKNSKTQSSLNFLQSGPRKFTKLIFSGLAPIQWVLIQVDNVFWFDSGKVWTTS